MEHAIENLLVMGFPDIPAWSRASGRHCRTSPALTVAGGLNQFKFVQTDILTSDETLWKVGCLHQWDPLEKALPQDWPWREPKENSYLWSLVSFWFRVCLTFWSLSKFDFCQVFFRGGEEKHVSGWCWCEDTPGWGGSCVSDIVSSVLMTSVLCFCPEFGMGLD